MTDKLLIDKADAMERLMNNEEMYLRWLDDFFSSEPLNEVEAAMQSSDYTILHKSLHKLKGVSANLSLCALSSQARLADEMVKSQAQMSDITIEVEKLKSVYQQTKETYETEYKS